MYLRVTDKRTGHEFDALDTDKRIGGVFQLANKKEYPPSPYPRQPKHDPLKQATKGSASTEKKEG